MSIESKSFPARSVARKYLQSRKDEIGCHVLGIREERLSTMAYVWVIETDLKQMKADLAKLEELRVKELAFLIVDMEKYRTLIDLFLEEEAVVEEQVTRRLSWHTLSFYREIQRTILVIRSRLGPAAPPVPACLASFLRKMHK